MSVSEKQSSVEIRGATIDDAPAIHAMVVALARDTGKLDAVISSEASIRAHGFGDQPAFQALIASRGNTPVGLALFYPEYSTWRGRRGVYLLDLYVAPAERGGGLGRRLVEAVAARAAAAGAAYVRLAVDAANARAAEFYLELGFAETAEDRLFALEGENFSAIVNG